MFAGQNRMPSYLIVDNSPLSLRWLARILHNIGPCETLEADDGVAAIEQLATAGKRVDAIISDLRMPRMNGLELLKEVRLARTGAPQNLPFFIVTDFAERSLAGLALGLDVDAFLARPPKMRALTRHLVRTSVERRRLMTAIEAEAAYGNVDLIVRTNDPTLRPREPSLPHEHEPGSAPATVGSTGRLLALENVPEGAVLSRDAVNSAGVVLLKAGENISAGMKAVLMSYAEIDESLANVWVSGSGF